MSTVRVDDHEGCVRLLTLDRPPANAIDETLLRDLSLALNHAKDDDSVRAVVVTGAGRFFSGGLDLVQALRRDEESAQKNLEIFRDALLSLLAFPKPTVAAVNGHAIAGGLIIALACDFGLGLDEDYVIGLNEVAIGASYPRVALEIVRLRLPHPQANELLLGGELYRASDGLRLGVVQELLPSQDFEEAAVRRAARLGAFPREAYAHTKAAIIEPAVERLKAETPEEASRGAAIWRTPESQAALIGQLQKLGKRPPP
ncbi:MAG: enoyl-CoA hydratase/isomerase family protein [Chloroflexi bacterium]|nr:enoyl-CoA hydratase/isomerase family protein [Chloroflexota bacterium]